MRALPVGFELHTKGRLVIAVRAELRDVLEPLLQKWAAHALPPGRPLPGGRGGIAAFELAPGLAVVLRSNRRGGLLGRVNHEWYLGWNPRPWRELRVSAALQARGVPTAEVLAAAVRWIGPGCYRGAVVSREIAGAVNLWCYLEGAAPAERVRACEAAAAATRRLHDAGIVHPDLNLQNYLVRSGEVYIIDCDHCHLGCVSPRHRRAAFARLCRSLRRLDPDGRVVTPACLDALRAVAALEGG